VRVSLIVARAENGVIGRANDLPWSLPADLKHFKALTTGHTIIFGRKTYQSVGRPLPNRRIIVVTRATAYTPGGVDIAHSLEEAFAKASGETEVFVGGGQEIYRAALPRATRVYLTQVRADIEGDVYFPALDGSEWTLSQSEHHEPDERNPFAYSFEVWDRRA